MALTLLHLILAAAVVVGALRLLARMPTPEGTPPLMRLAISAAVVGVPLLLLDLALPP